MRLLLQRVKEASVTVDGTIVGQIGTGLAVLVGFGPDDILPQATKKITKTLEKALDLRIFPDEAGLMNKSLRDAGGGLLLVSQFTLYADCRKGRRPSFHVACPPTDAERLFQNFCAEAKTLLPGKVQQGIFAADMDVALINWGPVTISLDSDFL